MNKQIAFVKESKDKVQAFDSKGNYMFTKYGRLASFTPYTIAIKNESGRNARIYDTSGSYKFSR